MRYLKQILTIAVIFIGFSLNAQEAEWLTDFAKAHQKSEAEGKPIFAFFTGSDWCGWCIRLQNAVLKKPEFEKWAAENVVLLELDFPRKKKLPAEEAQQNASIRNALKVTGYPTIWLMTTNFNQETKGFNLNTLGKLGYPRSEPGKEVETFLGSANQILARQQQQTAQ